MCTYLACAVLPKHLQVQPYMPFAPALTFLLVPSLEFWIYVGMQQGTEHDCVRSQSVYAVDLHRHVHVCTAMNALHTILGIVPMYHALQLTLPIIASGYGAD